MKGVGRRTVNGDEFTWPGGKTPPPGVYTFWFKTVIPKDGDGRPYAKDHSWGASAWLCLVIAEGPWAGTEARVQWPYDPIVNPANYQPSLTLTKRRKPTKRHKRFLAPLKLFGRPREFDLLRCEDVYNVLPDILENIEGTERRAAKATLDETGKLDILNFAAKGVNE